MPPKKIKVQGKFMDHFKKKRPTMAQQQRWFHWNNAPVHTAASLKGWMVVKGIQVLKHPLIFTGPGTRRPFPVQENEGDVDGLHLG